MSLKEILDRTRLAGEAKRSPEIVALMHRAVNELKNPDALGRILKVGARMPSFVLQGQGGFIDSADLIRGGPLVVTFYRGKW